MCGYYLKKKENILYHYHHVHVCVTVHVCLYVHVNTYVCATDMDMNIQYFMSMSMCGYYIKKGEHSTSLPLYYIITP